MLTNMYHYNTCALHACIRRSVSRLYLPPRPILMCWRKNGFRPNDQRHQGPMSPNFVNLWKRSSTWSWQSLVIVDLDALEYWAWNRFGWNSTVNTNIERKGKLGAQDGLESLQGIKRLTISVKYDLRLQPALGSAVAKEGPYYRRRTKRYLP